MGSDFILQSLLVAGNLHQLGLFLSQQALKVSGISSCLVGTVISQLEFSGDVLVVSGNGGEILLNLDLDLGQVGVGAGKFSHLLAEKSHLALVVLDDLDGVVVVDSDGLQLGLDLGEPLDGDVVLLDRAGELLVDIIVGSGELHQLLSLSLGSHLELAIGLVGGIKSHLKFSDGDCHLLLDTFNFNLQLGLRISQLAGKKIDFLNQLPLGNFKFFTGTSELLLKVSLELSQFLLKSSNTIKSLLLASISIFVCTCKLFTLMGQFAIVTVHISHALLECIQFRFQRLDFISKNTLVTIESFVSHLETIGLVRDLDNFIGTSLAVTVSLLIQISHLLQLGGKISVGPLRVLELGRDLLDDNLAVLEVLDENIDLSSELGLSILCSLQLLFQCVDGISKSIDFHGHLLLKGISFFNTETVLIFVLLLPVSIFLLPLGNGSFQSNLELTEFLNLDIKSLDGALKRLDLGIGGIDISGLIISSTAQLIKLGGELVLVKSGVLQGQLHLVELLGGLLGLHLEPGLGAGHVSTSSVEVFNLDVVFIDSDLKLLNNLLLVPGQSLDLLLELHHGGLVLGAEGVDLLLRLVVDVLQQLPQLGHLGLALPVDLEL